MYGKGKSSTKNNILKVISREGYTMVKENSFEQ